MRGDKRRRVERALRQTPYARLEAIAITVGCTATYVHYVKRQLAEPENFEKAYDRSTIAHAKMCLSDWFVDPLDGLRTRTLVGV